jgi:hypothetical protein
MDDTTTGRGISRRSALKKIGAGAAVAWTAPVLMSAVAPAFAASFATAPCPGCCAQACGCASTCASGSCFCNLTTEGDCFCRVGAPACPPSCTTSGDCPAGQRCLVSTCCPGPNVCSGAACGNGTATRLAAGTKDAITGV